MLAFGSISSRVFGTIVALCYVVLATASSVHEVLHMHEAVHVHGDAPSVSILSSHSSTALVESGDQTLAGKLSLPCFLCLTGSPHSIIIDSHTLPDILEVENIRPVVYNSKVCEAQYQLPSLRAPPLS